MTSDQFDSLLGSTVWNNPVATQRGMAWLQGWETSTTPKRASLSAMSERLYFGNIQEVIEPPNLIEVQLQSYAEFLQQALPPSKRKQLGNE